MQRHSPYVTDERLEEGLVIVLPGIEGYGPLNEAICDGLAAGGVDAAIQIYDWTSSLGPLYNLRAEKRNRRKAGELEAMIVRYKKAYPQRPVVLLGQSGGGAISLWAAEGLPGSIDIDGIVLMAPSLSPGYVLDKALSNCRRGIVSFYSTRDWFFLGLGTAMYGTMDGEYDVSAGMVGFKIPPDKAKTDLYRKLYEIGWTGKMAEKGHRGGHLTSGAATFVASYVAPFVLAEQWSDAFVDRVVGRLPARPEPATRPATQPTTRPAPVWRPRAPWTRY